MYLKTALAAYEMFSSNKDLIGAVQVFNRNYKSALAEIMDYEEMEYDPHFNNQPVFDMIIERFDSYDLSNQESLTTDIWSTYEGTWVAGDYLQTGTYSLMLEIHFTSATTVNVKWFNYRLAGFSFSGEFDPQQGQIDFLHVDDSAFDAQGYILFKDGRVLLHFFETNCSFPASLSR